MNFTPPNRCLQSMPCAVQDWAILVLIGVAARVLAFLAPHAEVSWLEELRRNLCSVLRVLAFRHVRDARHDHPFACCDPSWRVRDISPHAMTGGRLMRALSGRGALANARALGCADGRGSRGWRISCAASSAASPSCAGRAIVTSAPLRSARPSRPSRRRQLLGAFAPLPIL